MARERLMKLDWSFDNTSFDLVALTSGPAPGDVRWSPPDTEVAIQTVHQHLDEAGLKAKKKRRTIEELILRRDEDLVGVATEGDQILLVGRALPILARSLRTAVDRACRRGLEYWMLSFYEVIDGVLFAYRGAEAGRRVAVLGDAASFVAMGRPLAFEGSVWDGSAPAFHERDSDEEVDGDGQPGLEERLAKTGLAEWFSGDAGASVFLSTSLTVLERQR